jgi:hypothetical protein
MINLRDSRIKKDQRKKPKVKVDKHELQVRHVYVQVLLAIAIVHLLEQFLLLTVPLS